MKMCFEVFSLRTDIGEHSTSIETVLQPPKTVTQNQYSVLSVQLDDGSY